MLKDYLIEMETVDTANTPATEATKGGKRLELEALHAIAQALNDLDFSAQTRVLKSVSTLLEIDLGIKESKLAPLPDNASIGINTSFSSSEERQLSPKEFLHQKRPGTDVEKIACIAYYLTHYRNTPHFKTIDISQLNTEAAQIKFSNAAQAVDNATRTGLLVPAVKGHKQLSSIGELYVQELPDRNAAKAAIEGFRRKRAKRQASNPKADLNPQ